MSEGTPVSSTSSCVVCGRAIGPHAPPLRALRPGVAAFVRMDIAPREADEGDCICPACLARIRSAYVLDRLTRERGELSELEREVAHKAEEHASIVTHLAESFGATPTFGQRMADRVARVGGSWPFVIGFIVFLVVWMAINTLLLSRGAFDPYPYILLNLVLSCLAALQAPIIMMSQNRAAARDREQADLDFRVNLKAELEIAALHDKIDHLLHAQWDDLIELQQTQLDLLTEIGSKVERRDSREPSSDRPPAS